MRFLFKPITNKKQIGKRRNLSDVKYLVIHDTGNTSRTADAMAHYKYLQNASRYGSAHYYLDDKEIIQTIGDSFVAWAIGDKWGYKNNPHRIKDAYNSNSLSIELCINSDIDKAKAYKNLVELTKNLMAKFKIPAERVIRHFDATGKTCPGSWSKNNWSQWWQFKEDIKKPIEWQIDLSKDSEFGITNNFIGQVADALKGQKLNILPSVTIAQAILESNWGKSSLAIEANNLFGIKASKDWTGGVYTKITKEQKPNGNIYTINANFRKYESWKESIKDHDNFFISTPWRTQNYQKVLTAKNYKDQAQALRECGYATDLNYGHKLIKLIERLGLQQYDKGVGKIVTRDNSVPSDWAKEDWEWGKEQGITDGSNPGGTCTREQVIAMIRRYDKQREVEKW